MTGTLAPVECWALLVCNGSHDWNKVSSIWLLGGEGLCPPCSVPECPGVIFPPPTRPHPPLLPPPRYAGINLVHTFKKSEKAENQARNYLTGELCYTQWIIK